MQAFMNAMRAVAAQEFREWYTCLPEERLGQADKIMLPPSALHKLASKNISYPMMFHLSNPERAEPALHLHGGVLEFDAPEGTCYLPQWMMSRLQIARGGLVCVLNVTLPAGKSVVFQPHAHAFTKLAKCGS
jgi:ubiquitin fusion degradation protein 1